MAMRLQLQQNSRGVCRLNFRFLKLLWLVCLLLTPLTVPAQESQIQKIAPPVVLSDLPPVVKANKETSVDANNLQTGEAIRPGMIWRNLALSGGAVLVFGVYGQTKWWDDGFNSDFRTDNEGWFGRTTYSGGTDKLGHMYGNYISTRLLSSAFQAIGNKQDTARLWAAGTTLGIYTGIEILDGFSRKWRFSSEDALMNLAGTLTALVLETYPWLDKGIDIRLLYQPTHGGVQGFDPFGDYSGQTYLLVGKASGVPVLRDYPLLRYAELAVGYRAQGFGEPDPGKRSRHIYLGAGLNLSELLDAAVFKRTGRNSTAQRLTNGVFEYVQIPGSMAFKKYELE